MIEYYIKYKYTDGGNYITDAASSAEEISRILYSTRMKDCSDIVLMQREIIEQPITAKQINFLLEGLSAEVEKYRNEAATLSAENSMLKTQLENMELRNF